MKAFIGIDPYNICLNPLLLYHCYMDTRHSKGPVRIKGYDTKAILTCAHCGNTWIGMKDPRTARRFCSRLCYFSSNRGSCNGNFKGGDIVSPCQICGFMFSQQRNGKEIAKTCSVDCRSQLKRSRKTFSSEQTRLIKNARRAISSFLDGKCDGGRKWRKVFGYGSRELRERILPMLKEGMSLENHGMWHIDHIKPTSSFRFNSVEDPGFKDCWRLDNLQPLWALENIKKGNKL